MNSKRLFSLVVCFLVLICSGHLSAAMKKSPVLIYEILNPSDMPEEVPPGCCCCSLKAENIGKNQDVYLWLENVLHQPQPIQQADVKKTTGVKVSVDGNGTVVEGTTGETLVYCLKGGPGEPFFFYLRDDKKRDIAKCTIVPTRLRDEDKRGHSLELVYVDPVTGTMRGTIDGFEDGEMIEITSFSAGEMVAYPIQFTKGGVNLSICAAVVGKTGGKAFYQISTQNVTLNVRYQWGTQQPSKDLQKNS